MYLTQALHRAVQQHPDRIAVRFGGRHATASPICCVA